MSRRSLPPNPHALVAAPRPPRRPDEPARLEELASYEIGAEPDPVLDEITSLAARLCSVPMALVSIVDGDRQWFKARVGIDVDATPRDQALCAWTILEPGEMLEVPDARLDPRFWTNPMVKGAPFIRFYAGVPLVSPAGHALGTLCVLDHEPRRLPALQRDILAALARAAQQHLDLRRQQRFLAAMLDEQRRVAAMLGQKTSMLEAIMSTSVTAIVQLTPSGEITFANRRAEEILGLTRADILGRAYDAPSWRHTAIDGGPWPDEAQPFRRVLATREPVQDVEHGIEWPDGRRRLLSINGAPLLDEAGEVSSVVFSIADVTERRRAEDERSRLERELLQADKFQALGRLAGSMTHDLNNLLTIILGNVELVRTAHATGRSVAGMLSDVSTAAHRARELVAQTLRATRTQAPPAGRPVAPGTIVEEVARLLAPTLPARIRLDVRIDPTAPQVMAAPAQLHQVVMNLCMNAVRAMPDGAGRLSLEVERRVAPASPHGDAGLHAVLIVSDTGVGMDALTQRQMFDPFFTTRAPDEGSGLGLSVVQGIVKAHQGTISVRSRLGEGTVLEVWLPACPPAQDPDRHRPTCPGR